MASDKTDRHISHENYVERMCIILAEGSLKRKKNCVYMCISVYVYVCMMSVFNN